MAGAVGGGVDAAVGRRALQIVVAVELGFGAVPVVPLLVTVGARRVAGEGIAAGVARVVAIRLQGKQDDLNARNAREKGSLARVWLWSSHSTKISMIN